MPDQLPPLSLYIHIPWCERKCPYCDFNSHENKSRFSEAKYIQCLIDDFRHEAHKAQGRELQSIFIGGGTPSLFGVSEISRLLKAIENEIDFSKTIEVSLEANPASSQADYFSSLAQTSVNRVSLGVQSFQDKNLKALGRLHSSEEADLALEALGMHFENFNIDLMFGLPDQDIDRSLLDLQRALAHSPSHLSWYQLTIEPNTVFYRNTPTLPDEELVFEIQQAGNGFLEDKRYKPYEISAFSQENKQCAHNLNYWQFGDYLAIGAGAHGKVSHFEDGAIQINRYQKLRMPDAYMAAQGKQFLAKSQPVKKKELALEFFMNHLRLNQAVPMQRFQDRTGLEFKDIESFCEKSLDLKLITLEDNLIRKTKLGEKHVDSLLALF